MQLEDPMVQRLMELAARRGCVVERRPLFPYFHGLYVRDSGSEPRILLDDHLTGRGLAFVLAHELGHHCTGAPGCWSRGRPSGTAVARAERQANRFARLLLRLVERGTEERAEEERE